MVSTPFPIPNPKSVFIDPSTGLINRDWFRYLQNLSDITGAGTIGTTTQVLHGGGSGFSAVNLATDVTQVLAGVYGGTGISNPSGSLTLPNPVAFSGASPVVINITGPTNVTFPTSGTLLGSVTLVGDVTGTSVGDTVTTTFGNMASYSIKGNNTAATGPISDIAAGQFPATRTDDDASSGNIGEYFSTGLTKPNAIALTNSATSNISSILLTPGDWEVFGTAYYTAPSLTVIAIMKQGTSTVSGSLPSSRADYSTINYGGSFNDDQGNLFPINRISLSTTTSVYLVVNAGFSVSTLNAYGFLEGRRVR